MILLMLIKFWWIVLILEKICKSISSALLMILGYGDSYCVFRDVVVKITGFVIVEILVIDLIFIVKRD